MMLSLTLQQWDKFGRYVQPGSQCRIVRDGLPICEGILMENWPYEAFESRLGSPGVTRYTFPEYLCIQPFEEMGLRRVSLSLLEVFLDETWHSLYSILKRSGEEGLE